jgi:hypothetical protein
MYKSAYKYDEDIIFYFDEWGNKYVASGGSLAWRIKNPGLIHNRSHAAWLNNSIGTYKGLEMDEPNQIHKTRVKRYLIFATCIYSILLPLTSLWALVMGLSTYDQPNMNMLARLVLTGFRFSIPLSLFISLCLMWSKYDVYKQYNKALKYVFLPPIVIFVFIVTSLILEQIFDY